jgi:hypothetical protein
MPTTFGTATFGCAGVVVVVVVLRGVVVVVVPCGVVVVVVAPVGVVVVVVVAGFGPFESWSTTVAFTGTATGFGVFL